MKRMGLFFILMALFASSAVLAEEHPQADADASPKLVLPQFGDQEKVWGKVGLQYRARPEYRGNTDLNSDVADKNFFILQRARIGLGLNYAHWLKTFVQFQDARTVGLGNSSVAYTGNADLHQAWAQIQLADDAFQLKIGRQQLVYGDQRLIGSLEWANQGRVFDAVKARWNNSLGWLDLFASTFAADTGGNLMDSTTFYGAYNQLQFIGGKVIWEQYLLGLFDTEGARPAGVTYNPADPTDPGAMVPSPGRNIGTVGTRLKYDAKPWVSTAEVAYQFGTFNKDADVSQSALAAHLDLWFHIPVAMKPYVKAEANYASGDKLGTTDKSERFQNLFPTNHMHYGYMDLASWSNTINGSLGAGFTPSKYLTLSLDYWILARAMTSDDWYGANGASLLTNSGAPEDDDHLIGHEIDLSGKMPINKHLKVAAGMGLFIPQGFAESKGNGDPQFWAFAMLIAGF